MDSDDESNPEKYKGEKDKRHKKREHKKKHHRQHNLKDNPSPEKLRKEDGKKHKRQKREKKSSSRRKLSRKWERDYDSISESSTSSYDRADHYVSRNSRKRKKKNSFHRGNRRHPKRERDRDRKSRNENDSSPSHEIVSTIHSKYDALIPQLHEMFSTHPGLATEFPYILIRISSGGSINLSQVSDPSVAKNFCRVFQTLGCTSATNGEWRFDDGGRIKHNSVHGNSKDELVLIKLVRYLMDQSGLDMDAIQGINKGDRNVNIEGASDKVEMNVQNGAISKTKGAPTDICSEIYSLTTMLLEKFQSQQKDKKSSLAKELFDILNMIAENEIICLDAIPDESLRDSMRKLFMIIGLSKEEMEDNDFDGEENKNGDEQIISFGYVLPEEADTQFDLVKKKLDAAVTACRASHQLFVKAGSTKRTLGPSMPPPEASSSISGFDLQENSGDDDSIGPVPLGEFSNRGKLKGQSLSSEALTQIVKEREAQMIHATSGINPSTSDHGGREEWMMQPGEHDFLKGVLAKGIKSRTFKNEKGNAVDTLPEAPLDPEIQKQVDNIIKMHEESRGPSLIEQHRIQKFEKKMALKEGKGNEWSWNREKDLDSGRRVDKNHLKMVLGGASKELKDKFQGTYTKSFT